MDKERVNDSPDVNLMGQRESYLGRDYRSYENTEQDIFESHHSFKDYLLILRERIWYLIVVLFIALFGSTLYIVTKTKEYTATATLRVLRDSPSPLQPVHKLEPNQIQRPLNGVTDATES